jgi:hypothetical protein
MLFTSFFATFVVGAAAVPTSNIIQYVAAAPADMEGSQASPIVEITTPFSTIEKGDDAVGGIMEKLQDPVLTLWENDGFVGRAITEYLQRGATPTS